MLSDREQTLLGLFGRGLSNKEVALELNLSENTVRNHRSRIMARLGFHTSPELMRYALEKGFTRREQVRSRRSGAPCEKSSSVRIRSAGPGGRACGTNSPFAPARSACSMAARTWGVWRDPGNHRDRPYSRSAGNSLNGLKTFRPGWRKSLSLPVAMVRLWRRAVAAM